MANLDEELGQVDATLIAETNFDFDSLHRTPTILSNKFLYASSTVNLDYTIKCTKRQLYKVHKVYKLCNKILSNSDHLQSVMFFSYLNTDP